ITKLVDEPCACGLFAKRLAKVRARADEMVVCGMGNVGPWVFEEILRGIDGAGAEWQVVLLNNGRYDGVGLGIEARGARSEAGGATGEVRDQQVLANVRERFPDFWKNLQMGLYELKVTSVPDGSLRTGRKLRRIVDERMLTIE